MWELDHMTDEMYATNKWIGIQPKIMKLGDSDTLSRESEDKQSSELDSAFWTFSMWDDVIYLCSKNTEFWNLSDDT